MWNLLEKENVQSCDFGGIHSNAINYPEIKKKHDVLERALDWQSGEPGSNLTLLPNRELRQLSYLQVSSLTC